MANKKESIKKEAADEKKKRLSGEKYLRAIGRRKSAVAEARLYVEKDEENEEISVNGKTLKDYFPVLALQSSVLAPLKLAGPQNKFSISLHIMGGGVKGQAEAARLAIARALVLFDSELKKTLKDLGYLTRDSRKVERKKPGLKKARRAPQWQKR